MASYAMPQAWCPAKVSCGSSPGLGTGPGLQPAVLASQAESGCGCLECSLPLETPGPPAPAPHTMLSLTCDSHQRMIHSLWKLLFLIPSLLGGGAGDTVLPPTNATVLFSHFPVSTHKTVCEDKSVSPKHQC